MNPSATINPLQVFITLISLLFVAILLFSVGMIVKEHRERQQDIKWFEKLEEIITEVEQTEITAYLPLFTDEQSLEFTITPAVKFKSVVIRPISAGIFPQIK